MVDGGMGERVSHLGSLERVTQHQEKDGGMRGWMVVECRKGRKRGRNEEYNTGEEEDVMQSLNKHQEQNCGV